MMSLTPAISRIARAAPPAMTPVPGRGGLHQDPAGPGRADDRIDDGRAGEGHVKEVLARLFDALLHREAGLFRLAVAEPDAALAVADHHQCGEREATSALDDLANAVHLDGALFELLDVGHQNSSPCARRVVGEGRDATVVVKATAVEDDRGDLGLVGPAAPAARRRPWRPRRCRRPRRAASDSTDEAAARVRPTTSSMIWAEMCLLVRLTATRGRAGVPEMFLRRRRDGAAQFAGGAGHYLAAFPALRATRSPR